MNRLFGVPWMLSLTSTPLTMNTLSKPKLPAIVNWLAFETLVVTLGESSPTSTGRRPTGRRSISAFVYPWLILGAAMGDGASAVTVTVSVTVASDIVASTTARPPTPTSDPFADRRLETVDGETDAVRAREQSSQVIDAVLVGHGHALALQAWRGGRHGDAREGQLVNRLDDARHGSRLNTLAYRRRRPGEHRHQQHSTRSDTAQTQRGHSFTPVFLSTALRRALTNSRTGPITLRLGTACSPPGTGFSWSGVDGLPKRRAGTFFLLFCGTWRPRFSS